MIETDSPLEGSVAAGSRRDGVGTHVRFLVGPPFVRVAHFARLPM